MAAIDIGHATDRGCRREKNEDTYLVLLPPCVPEGVDAVVAVADGMGGHQAGEVASAIAVRVLQEEVARAGVRARPPGAEVLANAVREANAEIMAEAGDDRRGMGTTLTVALIARDRVCLAHVGDSRGYLLRDGRLQQLTRDHSWVADQVQAGLLSPDQAVNHPHRNLLTRALGMDRSIMVDAETTSLRSGDVLLLCSDGLHGVVPEPEVARAMVKAAGVQEAAEALVALANARGGPDNVTAVVAATRPQDGREQPARGKGRPGATGLTVRMRNGIGSSGARGAWVRQWRLWASGMSIALIVALVVMLALASVDGGRLEVLPDWLGFLEALE